MGIWADLAAKQLVKYDAMNTRDAMRLIAYWKGRQPPGTQAWRPVLAAVVAQAPERERITNRLVATDLLLKLIYGDTKTRPKVTTAVQLAVVDYVARSARILDAMYPKRVPPLIEPRVLDLAAKRLVRMLENKPAKSGGLLILLLLAAAVSMKRKK